MTMPPGPGGPPCVDEANSLLAPGPAMLLTGNNGELGVITIRTPTGTTTVQLPKADVIAWGKVICELGESMRSGPQLLIARPPSGLLRP